MGLTLRTDPRHPSGGYAILSGPDVAGVSALSVENVFSTQFLGPDGRWGKLRHAFTIAPAGGDPPAVSLGPEIVDHVLTDLLVALRDGDGTLLDRLVWPEGVVPRRDVHGGRAAADRSPEAPIVPSPEPPAPVPVDLPTPGPVAPVVPDPGPVVVEPRARRPWWLIAACLALVVVGVASAALTLRSGSIAPIQPPTPPVDLARHCAETFDGRVAAAEDASDDDRVKLAEDAIEASCGAQAFRAVDGTRWETDEPAAWYQARFYDPNETAAVFRVGHAPDARAAFDYYDRWADRSPRQAAALKTLCAADPGVVGDDPRRRRACAR